jgi:uncharacterized protein with ParB-like and HNH nuclease domain
MKSINQIFEKSIFRIPDYQRGYSWKEIHLDDFWQDLINLQSDKIHYTGPITIENAQKAKPEKWKDDKWLVTEEQYTPYYIVDGQQRITTVILFINTLLDCMEENEKYLSKTKEQIISKYIYLKNKNKSLQSFVFGYEIDDPSYEYLKTKIFHQQSSKSTTQPETSYTNNIGFAKRFFTERIGILSRKEREILFKKVTQQLMFDIKEVDEELDMFVVFETLNNRGKLLTNLEKLKNRLIYLSTLIPSIKQNEKEALRDDINTIWKSCYEFLGKNKRNQLNDDEFLRNHFILYFHFQKEKGFPYTNIFKEIFTVKNTVTNKPSVTFKKITDYIRSLQKAVEQWFIIRNPQLAFENSLILEEESKWLTKINRLRISIFYPLVLAVYLKTKDTSKRINFLKTVESFCFLNYYCAGKRSTYGNTEFPNQASQFYKDERTLESVIEDLQIWTIGDEGAFSVEKFIINIKDYFTGSKKSGYYDWPGIRYLLFEYDDFLKRKEESKVEWSKPNSIEHIYPQEGTDSYWTKMFKGFSPKQKKYLCNSLGNLVLLSTSKNSELSNNSYKHKRYHTFASGNSGGYVMGSHSENQLANKYLDWKPKSVYERGKEILSFFSKRWNVALTNKEIKTLLLVDDILMKKIR